MKIINQTKRTLLAESVVIADTPFKRLKGLLGRKEFKPGQALIIKPCNSIHTFFMRFSIDVLFVDKDNRVIGLLHSFRPFRFSRVYFSVALAIEFPANTLRPAQTRLEDIIKIEE